MNALPQPSTISRIAIFQALQLGDLLCATPAMRALRQHYPMSEITLIGSAWARDMVERLSSIDHFIPFPGYPGIAESPASPLESAPDWPRFDLAIQMHGAGKVSNGFVASLGAARSLGHGDPDDDRLTLSRPWQELEREPLRWLHLLEVLDVPEAGHHLEFPLSPDERRRAANLIGGEDSRPIVGVHVGASDPRRRWPPEAFTTVIDALAAQTGCQFVLTGSAAERELTARVAAAAKTPVIDLAGMTTLGEFGAVIAGLDLLLTNDTGSSHVAAAMRTPSVVLFGPADPRRWAPLDATRHRVINAREYGNGEDGARALQTLPPQVVLDACLQVLRNEPQSRRATTMQEQVA
jgi:ADP-heptose:LPS heptosyltransferase